MPTFLIFNNPSEAFQEFSGQMLFATIENLIIFVFIASAIFLIVSTPVAFFLAALNNYFKQRKLKIEIDTFICNENKKTHVTYDQRVCQNFIDTFSSFASSALALFVWNVLSIFYILFYIGDSISAVLSYLKFPFEVVSSYDFNNSILTIKNYETNWSFMLGIFIVTIFAYQIGKGFAPLLIEKYITDKTKKVSYA